MDMKCNKCGEPWEWFYIRDNVLENQDLYTKMEKSGGYVCDNGGPDFLGKSYEVEAEPVLPDTRGITYPFGEKARKALEVEANWQFNPGPTIAQCPACIGKDIEPDDDAKIRAELASLYGDDIDGFMADMEDFGL